MQIHSKAFPMGTDKHSDGVRGATFKAPEDAQNLNAQVLLVEGQPHLVVTWLELTRSELTELQLARARASGLAVGGQEGFPR